MSSWAISPPTRSPSPKIPSPRSTAKTSVFSSADSILSSSSISLSILPVLPAVKRKHGQETKEAKANSKRRHMGRPKNAWTHTRLRKLVRLYLMTDLEVPEIAKILQTEDFNPSKRDVQKQLESLLQPRPNQIRQRAAVTKSWLRILGECRDLYRMRRTAKRSKLEGGSQNRLDAENNIALQETQESVTVPASDTAETDWTWLDLDLDSTYEASLESPDYLIPQNSPMIEEDSPKVHEVDGIPMSPLLANHFPSIPVGEIQTVNPNDLHRFNFEIQSERQVERSEGSDRLSTSSTTLLPEHDTRSKVAEEFLAGSTQLAENYLPSSSIQPRHLQLPSFLSPNLPTSFTHATSSTGNLTVITEDCNCDQTNRESTLPDAVSSPLLSDPSVIEKAFSGEWPGAQSRLPTEDDLNTSLLALQA